MRNFTQVLISAIAIGVVGCVAGAGAGAGASASVISRATASPDTGHHIAPPACAAGALVLGTGPGVVPMTGEHAVLYTLTNRSPRTCTVRGYPRVILYEASGQVLPFRYADGGGPYVTSAKAATVVLAPRSIAYLLVAKYRCDLGIVGTAATIKLTLPAGHGQVFTAREPLGTLGSAGLSYCAGGRRDPGQLVTLSPVEPTQQAASGLP
jgi:hypothetical protein